MARFIYKWRYFKDDSKRNGRYVKYLATRNGVERCEMSWRNEPATVEQVRLINELVKEFPTIKDTVEYDTFLKKKSKGSATELIDNSLETFFDSIDDKENYIGYIAKRPRVEKQGEHGLFTAGNVEVDLNKVIEEVANHDGLVFTNILSLKREDAEAFKYNCAERWKQLIEKHNIDIAKAMRIPVKDLRWYAAFHNESHHPHVHLVTYSVGQEPYITEKRLDELKRAFAKDIFASEMHNIYVEQTEKRNALRKDAKDIITEIISNINEGHYTDSVISDLLQQLTKELDKYSGRMMYGYLPKRAKNIIDAIVDEIEKDERISKLYNLWYEQKELLIGIYRDEMPARVSLSANKEFKNIRNAVLQEALRLNDVQEYPFTDDVVEKIYIPLTAELPTVHPSFKPNNKYFKTNLALSTGRLLARITQAMQNNIDDDREIDQQVDRKLLKKIQEKKQAHGQKMG